MNNNKINVESVRINDIMAFIYYGKVNQIRTRNSFPGCNISLDIIDIDRELPFKVEGQSLIESAYSADRFNEIERVTKTEAAEILTTAFSRPFTVCFNKDNGEERTLRGRLIHPEPLLGRSMVEDLDVSIHDNKCRLRQVDHRTIKWLIVNSTKYEVK